MQIKPLFIGNRSATFQLGDEGLYELPQPLVLTLNGVSLPEPARTVVTGLYDLSPDTEYTLCAEGAEPVSFRTEAEPCTLDVRSFGAVGDGVHEDTAAIQTAILACPKHGRVLIPEGTWRVLPLFLKSGLRLELARGAVLQLETDRSRFPILPGMIPGTTPEQDLPLGTWEGDPMDSYAGMLTGLGVEDCVVYGEGTVDGNAQNSDWWVNAKTRRGAWRGNLLFLHHCKGVTVQGLRFRNSPSWNLHPYFSEDLKLLNLSIWAPDNSPNTDGFDPESCTHVLAAGIHFSVGDDCIAIKSGKLYMGSRYKVPCSDVEIAHCLMERGHGGVTIGSEMAGGVNDVRIHDCLMRNTDRGLRIKTRRGRGKDGIVRDVVFDHLRMEHVRVPFVANGMYFCDPDGHDEYVQTLVPQPVDERTPYIGRLAFHNIVATEATCAAYFLGIPEQPIECVEMDNVDVTMDPQATPFQPAMSDCVEPLAGRGVILRFVKQADLRGLTLHGCPGAPVECEGVEKVVTE